MNVNQDRTRCSSLPMGFGYFEKPQFESHKKCYPIDSHFYRPMALGTTWFCSPISDLYLSRSIAGSFCSAWTVARHLVSRSRTTAAHAAQRHTAAVVLHGAGQPVGDV